MTSLTLASDQELQDEIDRRHKFSREAWAKREEHTTAADIVQEPDFIDRQVWPEQDERYCRRQLDEIQRRTRIEMEPYIRRLVEIENRKPPKPIIIDRQIWPEMDK